MNNFGKWLLGVWNGVKSNPFFVAFYSAFFGAIASAIQDEYTSGHILWTKGGMEKLGSYALGAAVMAVAHLYLPQPSGTKSTLPPSLPTDSQPTQKENGK